MSWLTSSDTSQAQIQGFELAHINIQPIDVVGVPEGGGLCTVNSLSRSAARLPQHRQTKTRLKLPVLS